MADKNHKGIQVKNLKLTLGVDKKTAYATWDPPGGKYVERTFRNKKGSKSKPVALAVHKKGLKAATTKFELYWVYKVLDRDGAIRPVTGTVTTQTQTNATFSIPEGATSIHLYVKPISSQFSDWVPKAKTTGSGSKKKTEYTYTEKKHDWYTGKYLTNKEALNTGAMHNPKKPEDPVLFVGDDGTSLTIKCKSNDPNTAVFFVQLSWDGGSKTIQYPSAAKVKETNYRQLSSNEHTFVEAGVPGRAYTAKCRIQNTMNGYFEYSPWSGASERVSTIPATPGRPTAKAQEDGAYVSWPRAAGAESYEVEYADDKAALGTSQSQSATAEGVTAIPFPELEQAKSWWFRVRAKNGTGASAWSAVSDAVLLGKKPAAPTVWSSASNAVKGDPVTLSWSHNSADGSNQTAARLTYNPGTGDRSVTKGAESSHVLDTSAFADGTMLVWNVQTAGITGEFGPRSENRVVRIWEQPTVRIDVPALVTSYPFGITVDPESPTQRAVAFDISIRAVADHEVMAPDGTVREVAAGAEVFSRHYDNPPDPLRLTLSAGDATLADGQEYELIAACAMSSSLTCAAAVHFSTEFEPLDFAVGGILDGHGRYACEVRPWAIELGGEAEPEEGDAGDEEGEGSPLAYAPDIRLSIYRHESDGTMTLLARNLPNDGSVSLVDQHAMLGTQAYRIAGVDGRTGRVDYEDVSDSVVECRGLVVQWAGSNAAATYVGADLADAPDSSGKVLELDHGAEVSYKGEKDRALRPFIGRKHPSSRYGTQLGTGATWGFSVARRDAERVALLRELETLMDDCYVREPMGTGYWAAVELTWGWSADSAIMTGTLDIARVDREDECVVGS